MPQVINTNVMSLNAQRNLSTSGGQLATALQRLSSGLRINSAKDDAAGLAIAERFTTQIRGLNQAARNANDGISLAQTGEGALAEITSNLQRVRELAVQAANSTNSASDRAALDQEVQQRLAEIERVASQTSFNGQKILDGTFGTAAFQVGANVGETISIGLSTSMRVADIGSYVNEAGDASVTVAAVGAGTANTHALRNTSYNGSSAAAINGDLTINSVSIADSADYAGSAAPTYQNDTSAYAKAAAINASGVAGVTASAVTELSFAEASAGNFLDFTTAGGTMSYSLSINGQEVLTATGDVTMEAAVENINSFSDETGVVAARNAATGALELTAADGRNIVIDEDFTTAGTIAAETLNTSFSTNTATGANFALAAGAETYRGQVSLQSSDSITLGGTQALIGFSDTLLAATSNLSSQNVETVDAANDTMLSVDAALTAVSSLRSTLGAIQNRFESTITNLTTAAENLTASRSRIQDADFAMETANLTRAQILQQAGTAILAQANSVPQNVLSLLR
jgi:flagellin